MKKCFCKDCADYDGKQGCNSLDVDNLKDRVTGFVTCHTVRDDSINALYEGLKYLYSALKSLSKGSAEYTEIQHTIDSFRVKIGASGCNWFRELPGKVMQEQEALPEPTDGEGLPSGNENKPLLRDNIKATEHDRMLMFAEEYEKLYKAEGAMIEEQIKNVLFLIGNHTTTIAKILAEFKVVDSIYDNRAELFFMLQEHLGISAKGFELLLTLDAGVQEKIAKS